MERRAFLKVALGGAALAAGGAALIPREAQAASVPRAADLMDEMRRAAPAVATEEDLAQAQVQDAQVSCWRNRWGQLVCRRRVFVRRRVRRCWRDRWGRVFCRWV